MNDIREKLDASPMSRAQVIAVVLTTIINAVDAFDVLSMAFVAPEISRGWGINKAELGLALSSGFFGMIFGSFFISPLADRFGRRAVVLGTLAIMAVGMLMAAFAHTVFELALWRVLTGMGMGALIPINATLPVEYSNKAGRRVALAIMSIGFPLGGTLGGFAAATLMYYFTWHTVFLSGAAFSGILFFTSLFLLPEPPAFLLSKRPPNALNRLNDYLRRCGHTPLDELPPTDDQAPPQPAPYRAIFSKTMWKATVSIAMANFLCLMTVYYVLSWMPQLVADLGYSSSFATMVSSTAAMAGIAGVLAYGIFTKKMSLRTLAGLNAIGLTVATCIFGLSSFQPWLLLSLAGILGIFLYGGNLALYGVIVDTFTPATRATGVGFALGMGRVAGAISPALAGQLFFIGLDRSGVSVILSLCAIGSAALIFMGRRAASHAGL